VERQLFLLPPTDPDLVRNSPLPDRVARVIKLLKDNEPPEGYYLAFSGGKDSIVIKELARMSGVKFDAWFNNTTIDPPEAIRFIKEFHPDVKWNNNKRGSMMHQVATRPKMPPTRSWRWCCGEYKEGGGKGRVKIFGVRAEESTARAARWREVTLSSYDGDTAICPIVYWTSGQVWEFIRFYNLPYCSLYDEGFERIGCIGCPLISRRLQDREFERWPRFYEGWKRAIIRNWEKWHDVPNKKGDMRFQNKFKNGEALFAWWRGYRDPDYIRGACQSEQLWTNIPGVGDGEN